MSRSVLRRSTSWLVLALALTGPSAAAAPGPVAGRRATPAAADLPAPAPKGPEHARSEQHYRSGLELFAAGDREQALVEFELAHALYPSNDILFMIAQCEYHLGKLAEARAHYERYLQHDPEGAGAETARVRLAAIERRPGILYVMTDPEDVEVTVEGEGGRFAGQAPNAFPVPRGRYTVTVRKPAFQPVTRQVEIDTAQTRQMFFKLQPVPARLRVRTTPGDATLFVRGMRAENPYVQDVEAGGYEIYAEAPSHRPRRIGVTVGPGQVHDVELTLEYVRRSGRPELIGFWVGAGALGGAAAVAALLQAPVQVSRPITPANSLLLGAAAASGGAAALLSSAFVPEYIPDNLALHRIGASWVGAAEGLGLGLLFEPDARTAWIGAVAGLAAGTAAAPWVDRRPLRYGRAALVQSAAGAGFLGGMLAIPAFCIGGEKNARGECSYAQPGVGKRQALTILGGLNAGLLSGLLLAYLPDQGELGPRWQQVVLVDLGILAGAFAGALVATVPKCTGRARCEFESTPITARYALLGGAIGLISGWVLTHDWDAAPPVRRAARATAGLEVGLPMPALLPGLVTGDGQGVPGLLAGGRF